LNTLTAILTGPAAGEGGEFAVGFCGLGHFHNRASLEQVS